MQKKVLSEIDMYYGTVDMPKGWDIDRQKLTEDILNSNLYGKEFPFSRNWDMLNTYMRDHVHVNYGIKLVNTGTFGDIYKPNEKSDPLLQVDPVDLRNAPDYVFLYGVNVKKDSCYVKIWYDDNRRKGRSWDVPIENNKFILFPSTQQYQISANKSDGLNFILTTTYQYT